MDLIMVIHCHQPVGNFDNVFAKAHEKCYGPLLELLKKYPKVRVGIHFSGPLLEWLEANVPKSLDLLADLVGRKQVELLSGGFFEPLLASIPMEDARGQVLMMNNYLENRLGAMPEGFWLTERVWDPSLPLTLSGTGMKYTVVDDTHFYYAGLKPDEIYGSYITEKEGHTLRLLATPMIMRYIIPFNPVEDVMVHLKKLDEAGRGVVLYGDDGEKFGLWPGTHEWVIQKGWLDKFFSSISESFEWLQTVLPHEYISSIPPLGRIYLPQSSYEEMTEWALPPEQNQNLEDIIASIRERGLWEEWRPFIRGGVWDNFLVKYEEANRMHKKMLFLSNMIGQDREAREFLWRGQCNCAYWHGVFGGLYLGHLRRAVYENLLRAQSRLITQPVQIMREDIDKDGCKEILLWGKAISLGLAPDRGGSIFELALYGRGINLSDTLTRRFEAYHRRLNQTRDTQINQRQGIASIHDLADGESLDMLNFLVYDPYTRTSLLDHFLDPETSIAGYTTNDYSELGDFVNGHYQVEETGINSGGADIILFRSGRVGSADVSVRKTLRLVAATTIKIDYEFKCLGNESVSCLYGCEFNLTLYSHLDPKRYYMTPDTGRKRKISETGTEENIKRFDLINLPDRLNAEFTLSRPSSVWFFPIMTVSKSEEGFDLSYQGSNILFFFPLNLSPGNKTDFCLTVDLRELP